MKSHGWLTAVVLAAGLTGLNAAKPLMIDDTAYYQLARQIVQAPSDPFGFEQYWYDQPQPAQEVLAPPVFPYWFALSLALFGDQPLAWKLALFPFALVLTLALRSLFDRFTPGLTPCLLPLTVLSPVVLPSFNLMLDVPVLALSLGAVALFLRGVDGSAWHSVLLAGLVAGLAMQTKYTGFVIPGVLLLHAWLRGRFLLGILAVSVAVLVFTGWELYTAQQYGTSHFWYHVTKPRDAGATPRARLVLPLVAYLGGLAPAMTLVGVAGLRGWKIFVVGAAWILLGHVLLAAVSAEQAVMLRSASGRESLSLSSVLFGSLGLATVGVLAAVLRALPRHSSSTRFLAGWFALEMAGYFALSPFPAARRLQGLIVVGTLLVGRLAALTCRDAAGHRAVLAATVLGVALGLGYFAVDWADAHLEPEAALQAATWMRERNPDATAWFLGTWGFKFYAERLGMRHFAPGRSKPRVGDWLVLVPRDGIPPRFQPPAERFAWRERIEVISPVPLHTYSGYYGGHRPLDHGWPKKLTIDLYQVVADTSPRADSLETPARQREDEPRGLQGGKAPAARRAVAPAPVLAPMP